MRVGRVIRGGQRWDGDEENSHQRGQRSGKEPEEKRSRSRKKRAEEGGGGGGRLGVFSYGQTDGSQKHICPLIVRECVQEDRVHKKYLPLREICGRTNIGYIVLTK